MDIPYLYKKTYAITTNFLDQFDDLSPSGILDLFQDLAGRHAYLLNAGYQDMIDKGLYWVIARNYVKILKSVPFGDDLTVITWPLVPTRFYFDRHYEIRDQQGDLCIIGRSRWLIIDSDKRKMQASSVYHYPLKTFHPLNHFEGDFPSLSPVVNLGTPTLRHQVQASEIDHNHHFNNSRYADLIYNVLDIQSKDSIEGFYIYYHSECHLGDVIDVYLNKKDNESRVSGYHQGILVFNSLVTLRK